jgi:hypothetical protein
MTSCIINPNTINIHKTILVFSIFSLVSSIYLIGSFDSYIFASPIVVSDNEISNDGWDIVAYCYDSLVNNYFQPGYTVSDCDNSMLFYNEYCNERAFYPDGHICTNQRVINDLYYYIQERDLEGEFSSGSYTDIEFN